ncbi:translation initiation factor 4E [Cryptococcus neoformans AD1-7a]|nr:translation initiation factor 4E [Cryptococcus neoformans var. grubii AD1-7a]
MIAKYNEPIRITVHLYTAPASISNSCLIQVFDDGRPNTRPAHPRTLLKTYLPSTSFRKLPS